MFVILLLSIFLFFYFHCCILSLINIYYAEYSLNRHIQKLSIPEHLLLTDWKTWIHSKCCSVHTHTLLCHLQTQHKEQMVRGQSLRAVLPTNLIYNLGPQHGMVLPSHSSPFEFWRQPWELVLVWGVEGFRSIWNCVVQTCSAVCWL